MENYQLLGLSLRPDRPHEAPPPRRSRPFYGGPAPLPRAGLALGRCCRAVEIGPRPQEEWGALCRIPLRASQGKPTSKSRAFQTAKPRSPTLP